MKPLVCTIGCEGLEYASDTTDAAWALLAPPMSPFISLSVFCCEAPWNEIKVEARG
jgi:hypothetical protein